MKKITIIEDYKTEKYQVTDLIQVDENDTLLIEYIYGQQITFKALTDIKYLNASELSIYIAGIKAAYKLNFEVEEVFKLPICQTLTVKY